MTAREGGLRLSVLVAFWLASFAGVTAVLVGPLRTPWSETVLHPASFFLTGKQGGDSWRPMGMALDYLETPRRRTFYRAVFFSERVQHKGFQYPPSALLPVSLLRAVWPGAWYLALEVVTWLSVPVLALLCGSLLRSSWRTHLGPPPGFLPTMLFALAATVTFYPAIRAYRNGQAQAWINTLFAFALWLRVRGSDLAAGAAVAAAAAVKPQSVVLGLWALVRRRGSFAAGMALAGGALLAASVALYGLAAHLEYADVARYISRRGESFYPNQSVNGLLNRWFFNGENTTWMTTFPPSHPVVYAGTLVSSALLLAFTLLPRPARGATADTADFGLAGLVATMASPIAWEHHYGILLPLFAWALPALAARPVWGRATLPVLAALYVVSSHSYMAANRLADTRWNVVQSYLFVAALVFAALLHALRRTPERAER